jgi:hypothetical protein
MYAKMVTTITSTVEITDEGFGDIQHDVNIDSGDLPETAARALALGGARTLVAALEDDQ